MEQRIYLASRSPRRRELLRQIGIGFDLVLARESNKRGVDIDETPMAGEAAADYVARLARTKAEFGWHQVTMRRMLAQPVLAADTTVVLDGEIMGKPEDDNHAQNLLAKLSGRTHNVLTAICIAYKGTIETALSVSEVEFREIGSDEIRRYTESGESADKAGAYAIQGRAAVFVRAIHGSYSGIMGLPLFETAELLRRAMMPVPTGDLSSANE